MLVKRPRRLRQLRQQYTVNSQTPSRLPAYAPIKQADIIKPDALQYQQPTGFTKPDPYVLTTFPARPINAQDFISTFTTAEQTAAVGAALGVFGFIVPPQYVAVIQRLQLRVWVNKTGAIDPYDATTGAPNVQLQLDMHQHNNAIDQYNNLRVDAAVCNPVLIDAARAVPPVYGIDLPMYFLADGGAVVNTRLTLLQGAGTFTFKFVQPILYGTLLLAEGVNPKSEPGTKTPLPTFATSIGRPNQVALRAPVVQPKLF